MWVKGGVVLSNRRVGEGILKKVTFEQRLSSVANGGNSILSRGNGNAKALLQEGPGMFKDWQGGHCGSIGVSGEGYREAKVGLGRVVNPASDGRPDCPVGFFKPRYLKKIINLV